MNDFFKDLNKYNTLQVKLVFLFFVLTLVSTLTTLVSINLSVESYRQGPQPGAGVTFHVTSQGAFGLIASDDEIKRQIETQIKQDRENFRQAVLTLTFVLIGIQIVIALAGSYFVVKSSLDPLKKLNKTMKEINDLDLKSRIIEEDSHGEIGEVIDNFNNMIVKIQSLVEKEKEFTQNISHELKTPISAIRVNLESLTILNELDSDTKEGIIAAINSIDSLNKLIEDLTLLSSIEKRNFKLETFDASKIIEALVKEECGINENVQLNIENNVKRFILKGSSALFKRAICNLIENSIKYSKENPTININVTADHNLLSIVIKDNGIGIPKDKLKKIFERFYRIDQSRSRATGGSGLGLSITKEIIDLFNGQISVKSNIDLGTIFTIQIPA